MNILGFDIKFPFWTRNAQSEYFYDITEFNKWSKEQSNLSIALNHPLLTPALLFITKLFSRANIEIVRNSTGKSVKDHPMLRLLKNPNASQSLSDLLEALLFTTIANGVGIIWKKSTFGTSTPNALYVLDYSKIEFPDSVKKYLINRQRIPNYLQIKVRYDLHGENLEIPLEELMFFFDLPNVDSKNPYKGFSRIDGIKQTLYNTQDTLIAKSIIIRSNGKEMITAKKDGFPMTPEEKDRIERQFNNNYGLSFRRRRGIVSRSSLDWKSMHIIMRDLGSDESLRTDAMMIFTGLHLPSDVYSIQGQKSTYKNANQSLVSYIQNDLSSTLESILEKFTIGLLDENISFSGNYNHLPVMIAYEITKAEAISAKAKALNDLLKTGIPEELALEMSGFDSSIKLGDWSMFGSSGASSNQESSQIDDNPEDNGKSKLRLLSNGQSWY